jgi:hypothetical protein
VARFLKWGIATAATIASIWAGAQSLAVSDESALSALHALRFADLNRIVLRRDCRAKPELANAPICQRFELVPDNVQEDAALPYFKKHVSARQASEVLAFYSTPAGRQLSQTLLAEIEQNNPGLLSDTQLESLDHFNKSPPGVALSHFATDPEQSIAVIKAIVAYSFSTPAAPPASPASSKP